MALDLDLFDEVVGVGVGMGMGMGMGIVVDVVASNSLLEGV